jgi:hypothetical protein
MKSLSIAQRGEEGAAPLWIEKHDAYTLRCMEKAAPYVFAGQYRPWPAPREGGLIKTYMMTIVDAIPGGVAEWCHGWNLATSSKGDFMAGAKNGRLADGRYMVRE